MKIWELSVKRPIFMSAVLVGIIVIGLFSFKKTPVELFPDVTFPIVTVQTVYPGAGPNEIETLVSKPIEELVSTIGGIKNVRSINRDSISIVVAEFNLNIDIKYAEQQVRDKVSESRRKLPDGVKESLIRKVDPSAQPIITVAIKSTKTGGELYDLVNEQVKPLFEQVNQVGLVELVGGRKREVQIQIDRNKLLQRNMSVTQVAQALGASGQNVPAGKIDQEKSEMVFRTIGEFNKLDQIRNSIVSFFGNDRTTKVSDVANVVDTLEDEKMRVFLNGEPTLFLQIYKQSGANTIEVSKNVAKRVEKINATFKQRYGNEFEVSVVRDMSKFIWNNVIDVAESIFLGVLLTIIVVFLFLGSFRSTLITGFAIPVSLIGSFTFLYIFGVSINIMSLLAFSLAVGLLIDDAIVVRENIFRHLEMGKKPIQAALDGTAEVGVAVIAVTLAVLAVFGPIAFLSGVVGQFFKSFGLGVCFVMIISLFDALSNAPMLSAYFGGKHVSPESYRGSNNPIRWILYRFDRFQATLEDFYNFLLNRIVKNTLVTILSVVVVSFMLAYTVKFVSKTFLPPDDSGEFIVAVELKPGTTLSEMTDLAKKVEQDVRNNTSVETTLTTVGDSNGKSYVAEVYIKLTPFSDRKKTKMTTTKVKEQIREMMKKYNFANPKVKTVDFVGAGQRPFVVNILGQDLEKTRTVAQALFAKLQKHPAVMDPEITDKPGLPEFQVRLDKVKAHDFGVTAVGVGTELRAQVEGLIPAKFRENGLEYDVRVRLQNNQRDLDKSFNQVTVPNMNFRPVYLNQFASQTKEIGYASINRENRGRYISIEADISPTGPGMGGAITDINQYFSSKEIPLPEGISYRFVGQAENFQELAESIQIAGLLAIVFIFLVLASLYESIVTPFTIMIVIPFAIFGGFFGLFVMNSTLDLFSMIGCVMLMGLATKNSIILVDYINQKIEQGLDLNQAIVEGCKTRLRPILMTTLALVAGMLPVAIGLNEASSQRKSLGIAVIGGVIISTLLTLVLIPAVFSSIERSRRWMIEKIGKRIVNTEGH